MASFNRREDDFTSLRAYNDYLEEVETLTFNLLNNINVSETESKLSAYASQNASSIAHNAALSTQESASIEASSAADKERARLRRDAARREADEERSELAEGRREIINKLANDPVDGQHSNAEKIAREGQKVLLKRSSARRNYALGQHPPQRSTAGVDVVGGIPTNGSVPETQNGNTGGLVFKGLKPRDITQDGKKKGREEEPYDPFGGLGNKVNEHGYFVLQDHYDHPWLEQAEKDPVIKAGGYDLREYYERAMVEAFAGLGVCVADEMGRKEEMSVAGGGSGVGGGIEGVGEGTGSASTVEMAVKAAANAAVARVGKGMKDDDVF